MPYKPSPQTLARAAIAKSKMSAKIRARSGETAPLSVKKASTEVKPSKRASELLQASRRGVGFGAGKNTAAVGGEHGGSGNVAPQHGPVTQYTQDQIDAMNKELGIEQPSPEEKAKAVNLAKFKALMSKKQRASERQFDVPTLQQQYDDLRDVHDSLHSRVTRSSMDEEVELEEGKIAKALAVGAMSLASMGANAHTDTTKSVAQLAAERPALAQRLKDIGATGQVPASDKRAAELQRNQDQEMPASERRAKELKKEEVESVNEDQAADWQKVQSMEKGSMTGGKDAMRTHLKYLNAVHAYQKKHGLDTVKTKKKIEGINRTLVQMGEEVEQIDEVTKQEAEAALGGPVKEKPTMPPGKQPAGHRYVRNLARRAMKAGLKKEEAEQVVERNLENKKKKDNWVRAKGVEAAIKGKVPFDRGHSPLRSGREVLAREDIMNEEPKDAADAGEYDYEGDMAKSQLRSIMANSKRLHDMLEENTNLPEWVQSKITLAQDYIQTAASYMEAEMNEETKLDSVGREDADVDNDGDSDNTDNYLKKKRAAINMAIFSRIRNKTGK